MTTLECVFMVLLDTNVHLGEENTIAAAEVLLALKTSTVVGFDEVWPEMLQTLNK